MTKFIHSPGLPRKWEFYDLVRKRAEHLNLDYNFIAKLLGVSRQQFWATLKDDTKPPKFKADRLSTLLIVLSLRESRKTKGIKSKALNVLLEIVDSEALDKGAINDLVKTRVKDNWIDKNVYRELIRAYVGGTSLPYFENTTAEDLEYENEVTGSRIEEVWVTGAELAELDLAAENRICDIVLDRILKYDRTYRYFLPFGSERKIAQIKKNFRYRIRLQKDRFDEKLMEKIHFFMINQLIPGITITVRAEGQVDLSNFYRIPGPDNAVDNPILIPIPQDQCIEFNRTISQLLQEYELRILEIDPEFGGLAANRGGFGAKATELPQVLRVISNIEDLKRQKELRSQLKVVVSEGVLDLVSNVRLKEEYEF